MSNKTRKRASARAAEITGEWYCRPGHHHVRTERIVRNGRAICAGCVEHIKSAMRREKESRRG